MLSTRSVSESVIFSAGAKLPPKAHVIVPVSPSLAGQLQSVPLAATKLIPTGISSVTTKSFDPTFP